MFIQRWITTLLLFLLSSIASAQSLPSSTPASAPSRILGQPSVLRFVANTDGVSLFLDGGVIGALPPEKIVSAGTHIILVQKEGYLDFNMTIVTQPGEVASVAIEMIPAGSIQIDATGIQESSVFLDGQKQTEALRAGKAFLPRVAIGEHTIEIKLSGIPLQRKIFVKAGETATALFSMGPSSLDVGAKTLKVADESFLERRNASFGARTLSPASTALSLSLGAPNLLSVRIAGGLYDKLDLGLELRVAGALNTLAVRTKHTFYDRGSLAVGVEGALGYGLGPGTFALRPMTRGVELQSNCVASFYFDDLFVASGWAGLHGYSDKGRGTVGFAEVGEDGKATRDPNKRDNGMRVITGVALQLSTNKKLSYDLIVSGNPGGLGSGRSTLDEHPRRLVYELGFPLKRDTLLYAQVGITYRFPISALFGTTPAFFKQMNPTLR